MEACVFGCCDRMNFMITNVINRFPGVEGQGVKDVCLSRRSSSRLFGPELFIQVIRLPLK